MTTLPTRPTPLFEVIAAGGDLRSILGADDFSDLVQLAIDLVGCAPTGAARQATDYETLVDDACTGADPWRQIVVTAAAWLADLARARLACGTGAPTGHDP